MAPFPATPRPHRAIYVELVLPMWHAMPMFHVATRRANLSRPNAWRFCVGPAGFKKRGVGFAGVGLWIRGFLLAGSASAWGWDLVFECLVSGMCPGALIWNWWFCLPLARAYKSTGLRHGAP